MSFERRNFLGLALTGMAAAAARAIPGGEATRKIATEIILPESMAAAAAGEPLLVTSLDDPRATQFTHAGGPLNNSIHSCVWFGASYDQIQRLSDTEYAAWLKGHMQVNRDFHCYGDLREFSGHAPGRHEGI